MLYTQDVPPASSTGVTQASFIFRSAKTCTFFLAHVLMMIVVVHPLSIVYRSDHLLRASAFTKRLGRKKTYCQIHEIT